MKQQLPFLFALGTALCWGCYGPVLAQARSAEHSAFKPYVAIGLAYLVWSIAGGLVGMRFTGASFSVSGAGAAWGFAAGTLGAFGALNLTLAMFSGGSKIPYAVMPVVFGGAVTVAALVGLITSKSETPASPWLWVGVVGMGICIVLVAYNTPHGGPAHKPQAEAASSPPLEETPAGSAESPG